VQKDPSRILLSNIPDRSTQTVNTERIPTKSQGMSHRQGGWPDEIDPQEVADVTRYMKKMNRDATLGFAQASVEMTKRAEDCMLENNQIDLFEEYFAGEQPEHLSETITTKTMMIFKDPSVFKRAATSINWHPDVTEQRVGVTYAMLRFQQMPHDMPRESYIWNLNNPNFPEKTLAAPSPLCTMAFNLKNPNIIVGGSYNGSLSFFDLSVGNASGVIRPVKTTFLEKSHHDPVYDVQWSTVGKSGSECFSVSTDGRILWWDMKDPEGVPREMKILEDQVPCDGELKTKILGGTSLEYNSEVGPLKYLIGTEQGYILQANKKKTIDINMRYGYDPQLVQDVGKHHGPVYSLWRNPDHPKFFLSVGDWSANIWSEE
jgi:dynein intermediate chain 2